MQSKIALLAALSGFLAVSTARGDQGDVFWRRCPLVMGGTRRISFDHKLFTSCNKPIKGSKFGEVEWVWGELDLGKCFVNDNGEVKARYMGNMQMSCSKCDFDGDSTLMQCSCPNGNGEWVDSEIELSDYLRVKEDDGMVCCRDMDVCGKPFDASEYHVPPPEVPYRRWARGEFNGTEPGRNGGVIVT